MIEGRKKGNFLHHSKNSCQPANLLPAADEDLDQLSFTAVVLLLYNILIGYSAAAMRGIQAVPKQSESGWVG
jgi:hypothetical protein